MSNFETALDVVKHLRDECYEPCDDDAEEDGVEEGAIRCETLFDEYLCWPATEAGRWALRNCSGDFLKAYKQGVVRRRCTENGSWSTLSEENSVAEKCAGFFVNITRPLDEIDFYGQWIPFLKKISYCGYTISILSLILSIFIFVNIKRLHCPRNKLHINMYVSFILRSLMSILKDSLFVRGTALKYETVYDGNGEPIFSPDISYSWVCKAIISVRYYVILSNFMLMLMEGTYLHNLMFLKLVSDRQNVAIYCFLGWGLPVIFIIPWIILRVLYEDLLCWTTIENNYISLFIDLPIGVTVAINFILFLTIVRVLTAKLNNTCMQQKKTKYRKLLKATLILIPVFGVPYAFSLLMSIYIKKSAVLEIIYLFFDQTFAAFQGLFAALVYCLLNEEVQVEIRRKYVLMKVKNDKEFRRSRTISNTQQISMQINEETHTENIICMTTSFQKNQPDIVVYKETEGYF